MPLFSYKARDTGGKVISGELEAGNKTIVVDKLRAMGYFVASVEEIKPKADSLNLDIGEFFVKIKPKDLVIFNNQLATMISSGLTLTSSLNILTQQIENTKLKKVVAQIRDDVEGGTSFSAAIEKHPNAFPSLFVNMIRAGETGGALDEILHRLSIFSEQAEEVRSNVKTALTYPVLIVVIASGVVSFMVFGVFPKFEAMFKGMGVDLPLPTQILLNLSHILKKYWLGVIISLVISVVLFIKYNRTKAGKLIIDTLILKVPIFGELLQKVAISRFSRTLGTLLTSGVPIMQSLRIVQATVGNEAVAKVIESVIDHVNRGESMAKPLRENRIFPPMVGHMVSVGEEAGTLDTILGKIADFYDKEVADSVKRLSSVIEPILLVGIGGFVGLVALALFLPMFNMVKVIK